MPDTAATSAAPTEVSPDDAPAPAPPWLGRSIGARLAWHARLPSRAPDRSVGLVVRRGQRFSSAIGRSLAARSSLGIRSAVTRRVEGAPATGPEMAIVEPPAVPRLAATRAAALAAELALKAKARARLTWGDRAAPRVAAGTGQDQASVTTLRAGTLPRAALAPSAWGSAGPGGFMARLRSEALPVRPLPDVAAVGQVLTTREARHSDASRARPPQSRPPRPSLSSLARQAAGRTGTPADDAGPARAGGTSAPAGDAALRMEDARDRGGSQRGRSSPPVRDAR
ncbi:MAG: hypothetical protein M0010_07905, partial [Actinomycetota bacterium]|nr:hypothetical protein [Actinomycetota bacterium]